MTRTRGAERRAYIDGPSFPGHLHELHAGRAPHDAVVHQQNVLAQELRPDAADVNGAPHLESRVMIHLSPRPQPIKYIRRLQMPWIEHNLRHGDRSPWGSRVQNQDRACMY